MAIDIVEEAQDMHPREQHRPIYQLYLTRPISVPVNRALSQHTANLLPYRNSITTPIIVAGARRADKKTLTQ